MFLLLIFIALLVTGFNLKDWYIKGLASELDDYNCVANTICSTSIIEGNECSCNG